MSYHPNLPDAVILRDRELRAHEANRPEPDPRWCRHCNGDGQHEEGCPELELVPGFVAALSELAEKP